MTEARQRHLAQVAARRHFDLTVVLENIWDPHNVAAILRSCDAVGVQIVHLVYTTEKFPRIGAKAAAGVKKWLTISRHKSIAACYRKLHRARFKIYSSDLAANSRNFYELNLRQPTALVFGNEHRGVSDQARQLADGTFHIPMAGFAQSLNISVAVAVTLYEACRQRRTGPNRHLSGRRSLLLRQWEKRSPEVGTWGERNPLHGRRDSPFL